MPTLAKFLPNPSPEPFYREVLQPNDLRWQLYKQEGDSLIPQTTSFRCKDFFNDVVGWFYGKKSTVYGFDTEQMEFNPYGVFLRLFNVTGAFTKNVDAVLNPLLNEKLKFVDVAKGEVLTLLPRELFNNTFLISKVTHLLRLCNVNKEVLDHEALKQYHLLSGDDACEMGVAWDRLKSLTIPEKYQTYWYYAGTGHNSLSENFNISILHNNGYRSWCIATNGEVQ